MYGFAVGRATPDATLRGTLIKARDEQPKTSEKKYFFLTDVCKPLEFYFKTKYPEKFQISIEKRKLFALGDRIHKIMEKAIEKMDNFIDVEANLDGQLIGLPVRGRIDAETNSSIFEFKSKDELPKSVEEIIEKYPQDIEQIAFYAFLDPMKRKEHYLVFVSQDGKYQIKVFKLTVKSHKGIGNELSKRIELLQKVVSGEEQPAIFSRCRYCGNNCELKKENACNLHSNPNPKLSIKDFITLESDKQMEDILKDLAKPHEFIDTFSLFNIITSRKTLHKATSEIELEPFDQDPEKIKNKNFFETLIYNSKLSISGKEYKTIMDNIKIKEIYLKKNNFIKIGDEIHPVLVHVSDSEYKGVLMQPSEYKIGELAMLSALTGFSKGYILTYYPNLSDEIRVFEIKFNFSKDTLRILREIVDILKSKDASKIALLPECPSFIHEDECAFKEKCKVAIHQQF